MVAIGQLLEEAGGKLAEDNHGILKSWDSGGCEWLFSCAEWKKVLGGRGLVVVGLCWDGLELSGRM